MATDLEQNLFDALWDQDDPTAIDACTNQEERDHALWIAVAFQRLGTMNALLDRGTTPEAQEAALALLCRGLQMAGDRSRNVLLSPVRADTPPFWGEVEQAMGRHLDKHNSDDQGWPNLVPTLVEGVPTDSLERFVDTLGQAIGPRITEAQAMLQAEIDRRVLEAV